MVGLPTYCTKTSVLSYVNVETEIHRIRLRLRFFEIVVGPRREEVVRACQNTCNPCLSRLPLTSLLITHGYTGTRKQSNVPVITECTQLLVPL